jgi:hypothetical protein
MHPDCYKEWSRKFLREHFTQTFLNQKYRPHLEDVLFDKEKALLPEAQLIIEDKIRKQHIRGEIVEVDRQLAALYSKRNELEREFGKDRNKKERAEFVRQCPAEGCRGFLSTQWKCGICELWTCPECHELKGPVRDCDHTCDPNNVETARMLAKDSKPCPSCQSLIFKISGCNQMFCTQCHTAFCWSTGKINKQNIHNPHYFEWLQNNPNAAMVAGHRTPPQQRANPNEINCDAELSHYDWNFLLNACNKHPMFSSLTLTSNHHTERDFNNPCCFIYYFGSVIRNVIHLAHDFLRNFPVVDYIRNNEAMRVAYLEGMYNDADFKKEIQRRDKKNRKNVEIVQIVNFASTASKDIIVRVINHIKEAPIDECELMPFVKEFEGLVLHCNELFKDVSYVYGTVKYQLREDFARD